MKRTDATGATVGNKFTNGNPSLSIPATVVDDSWLNSAQEEIAAVVENGGGLTLDQTNVDLTQLLQAINIMIASGGAPAGEPGSANVSTALLDNQASPVGSGIVLDDADEIGAVIDYHVFRRNDSQSALEMGTMRAFWDSENSAWEIALEADLPDAQVTSVGVAFTIDNNGEIFYTSSSYAGANYSGTFKATVKKIKA